jgi:TRAP-type C4-dicarboxylate transport system permease small subunit
VFDIMFTTPAYHQADTGVGLVMDGLLNPDTALLRESGVFERLDTYYRDRYGLTLLALIPASANQLLLRDPLDETGLLNGRKIRSNAAFEGMVRGLGGAPVGLPPADIYPSLERGVIDGTAVPEHAAADYRFYEVTSYMARPGFGHNSLILMANAASFDALPEEDRRILLEQAEALETSGAQGMADVAKEQTATMQENGVEIIEFPVEVADRLSALFAEGTTRPAFRPAAPAMGLRRALTRVSQVLSIVAAGTIALMAGANVVEVGARYLFGSPLNWGSDLSAFSLCACIFLALPEVTRRHQHAAITILPESLPKRMSRSYRILLFCICAGLCLVVTWFAGEVVLQQHTRGVLTPTANQIPRWWLTASVALGLLLSAANFLVFAITEPVASPSSQGE